MVIDQKQKNEKGEWVGTKVRIFEDELLEFQRVFGKMVDVVLNYFPAVEALKQTESSPTTQNIFLPPVLAELSTTSDWKIFEHNTYYLLKLLGIQNAYKFSSDNQAGRADGFFRFNNFAVMYDCTIQATNIETRKEEQITNYCNRLQSGQLEFAGNNIEEFRQCNKQVWIITRAKSRPIRTINNIIVKIIDIERLLQIYEQRLLQPMSNVEFEMLLSQL
ncbi:MAG: hypothetical protein HC892_10185 [Saprospiraceae bacterium]|nr:hypothetical protein [Saprospiraceae bacterium]